jgi:hypothetical protein
MADQSLTLERTLSAVIDRLENQILILNQKLDVAISARQTSSHAP